MGSSPKNAFHSITRNDTSRVVIRPVFASLIRTKNRGGIQTYREVQGFFVNDRPYAANAGSA